MESPSLQLAVRIEVTKEAWNGRGNPVLRLAWLQITAIE
jgi:hypothetical protein